MHTQKKPIQSWSTFYFLFFYCLTVSLICFSCANGGQGKDPFSPDTTPSPNLKQKSASKPQNDAEPKNKTVTPNNAVPQSTTNPSGKYPGLTKRYDFAKKLDAAHIRSGGLLVDFGTPNRHKHTLGDWKTGWRGDYAQNNTTFSYLSGNTARIFFDAFAEEAGAGTIAVRARGIGSTKGRVYLNDKFIGSISFTKDNFSHANIPFSTGIKQGKNEILLRFNTKRPGHDGKPAALAVDYVRISFSNTNKGPSSSSAAALHISPNAQTGGGISLRAGESATYYLPVPDNAVIKGMARLAGTTSQGAFQITATTNEGETIVLQQAKVTETQKIHINLDPFEKQIIALQFHTTQGEVAFMETGIFQVSRPLPRAPGNATAKNILLVLIDTLRADHLSLYNPTTRVRTNHLDAFGLESTVFSRALAQENWTKPSVATLLTGLYPQSHQTKDEKNKVPQSISMISEHLQSLDFATAGFVANGYVSGKFGFKSGWDKWTNYVREGKPNRAKFVADDAIAWLNSRNADKPFFLYVHTIDPHVPYIPPKRYQALYDAEPYNGPVSKTQTAKVLEKIKTGAIKLNARDKFRLEALYDGEITYHDDHLARLYSHLDKKGLLKDTLIIVTSDHGEEFFDHGSVGHGHTCYEELLHVPLVVRLPGSKAKTDQPNICDTEVGLVDIFPTICESLSLECPPNMEGTSLLPLIQGKTQGDWPSVSFSDFLNGQRVARTSGHKLIYRGLKTTLFDLIDDPKETRDRSSQLPIALTAMQDLLGMHQGRFVDTEIIEDTTPSSQNGRKTSSKVKTGTKNKKIKHKSENAVIDPKTRKQLEALGYMGD